MSVGEQSAQAFNHYRGLLFGLAYRMLGSATDAEDIVQEAFVRWLQAGDEKVQSPRAYLSTIVTRLCINQAESARTQREVYAGSWLPEPISTEEMPEGADPEKHVETEESISLAFLVLLEQLQPFERAVFLLREVFEYEFAEIAAMLGKSEAACRRSFSRAKQHLVQRRPRFSPSPEMHRQLLTSFLTAVQGGDMTTLTNLLSENVVLWADGGGKVKQAALRPIRGREAVARFSLGTRRFWPENAHVELEEINGQTALIIRTNGQVFSVLTIDAEQGYIQAIRIIANPDKLARV
ncbi:MAG: RNA polymerase sigma-70 factor [Ktedonobacteraceae bacterium]|nr:RNA polymerase sigma-70 factor [Ktedonobacteraceae bacterium]